MQHQQLFLFLLSPNFLVASINFNSSTEACTDEYESIDLEARKFLKTDKKIGRGVYKALEVQNNGEINHEVQLAIRIKTVEILCKVEEFENETKILKYFDDKREEWKKGGGEMVGRRIIQLEASGISDGHSILVMELAKGTVQNRWGQFIKAKDVNAWKIKNIIHKLLLALQDLHQVAIHLDLSLSNFVYANDPTGEFPEMVKLIDFESAKMIGGKLGDNDNANNLNVCVNRSNFFGTPEYLSPEHLSPHPDGERYQFSSKTDIWAIGVILYYFVFFEYPFDLREKYENIRTLSGSERIEQLDKLNEQSLTEIQEKVKSLQDEFHGDRNYEKWRELMKEKARQIYTKFEIDAYAKFIALIQACIQMDPLYRPTVRGILDYLKGNCNAFETEEKTKKFTAQRRVRGKIVPCEH